MTAQLEKPAFLVLLVVVRLLFGAKRLPDLARGVGWSVRILKSESSTLSNQDEVEPLGAPTARLDEPAKEQHLVGPQGSKTN